MATLQELRNERLRKLEELKKLGINPYPAHANRTHYTSDIVKNFAELEGKDAIVSGRIVNIRKFGKIAFIVLKDASGALQLFMKHGTVQETDPKISRVGFDKVNLLDTGDFIEASGQVIKTQTGEISVDVASIRLLAKSLRPLPTEQDGFTNKEERLRRRYIDTNVNPNVYNRYIKRSNFWQATREFLIKNGFVEINIPVLEHTPGGADAKPFVTHMDALDQDFYLRISHELPLKRLVGGGYEKVFDIGPRFRNENYTDEHLPEHVAMEWYWAYADWHDGMQLTQKLIRYVADKTWGSRNFKLANGQEVDLGPDGQNWPKISFVEEIKKHYEIDVFESSLQDVKESLSKHKLEIEKSDNRARGIDKLWKKIRTELAGPAFLIDIPTFLQPLAKTRADDPRLTEQFNLILGGTEACKAYSELNDPIDQLNRFIEQQNMREAGDEEAQMLDIDYVEMLEYGMPPACGFGYSERLFWMLEGVTAREGVPFPQLRAYIDETTTEIYPQLRYVEEKKVSKARPQDFTRRIVSVVNKNLEPWQVANAVAHMATIIGNNIKREQLVTSEYFESRDKTLFARNSQYPIVIKRASEKELHKLFEEIKRSGFKHHVFIKEMLDTTDDKEIAKEIKNKNEEEVLFYGLSFFATNEDAESLTRSLQLWK